MTRVFTAMPVPSQMHQITKPLHRSPIILLSSHCRLNQKKKTPFFWAGVKSPVIENPSKIRKKYQLANWENKKMFHPTKCRDSRKYWGSLFPNIEHNSLIWFSLCSFVKNNLYWITGSLNFYLGKTFYSVIVARGSLREARGDLAPHPL